LELEQLDLNQLKKLGDKGRGLLKEEQDRELSEIRKKHHVK